jgi:hypothetical protein
MKTAQFEFKTKYNRSLYGTVTLKNDGKISVSLMDGKYFSSAERYQAKILGQQIAKSNFIHESVKWVKEDSVGLVKQLTEKTQDLKKEFVERTKEWERKKYHQCTVRLQKIKSTMYDENGHLSEDFCKHYDLNYEIKNVNGHNSVSIKYDKKYHKSQDQFRQLKGYVELGEEYNVKVAESMAIRHYENSIHKLSARLGDKGITKEDEVIITSEKIGVNFHCYITSGDVKVHAWTIIAEGPIQKPHYRYLVK